MKPYFCSISLLQGLNKYITLARIKIYMFLLICLKSILNNNNNECRQDPAVFNHKGLQIYIRATFLCNN